MSDERTLRFTIDGELAEGHAGDTLAAALLRSGVTTFTRSIKYHRPRGPFCFTGSCGQCLVTVDGVPSLPACQVPLEDGMKCERQNAPLGAGNDLLRATDFLFSSGLDHHHLMIQSRLLGRVALEVARRLAGLGELPLEVAPPLHGELRTARIVVVGAGPAGIAAARAAGRSALLLERDDRPGGDALLGVDPAGPDAAWAAREAAALECEVLTGAEVVGLYRNETKLPGNALLAVRQGGRMLAIVAGQVVVATGGVSQPMPFPGVDRPGVYAARGLLRLHAQSGVRVGRRVAVAGEGRELVDCARALQRAGYELARVVETAAPSAPPDKSDLPFVHAQVVRALGDPVRALDLLPEERVRCDAIALAWPRAPLHDLASSCGAKAQFSAALNGFPLEVDERGRTTVSWIFAAGRVCGKGGADAAQSGTIAGTAALDALAHAAPHDEAARAGGAAAQASAYAAQAPAAAAPSGKAAP